MVTGAARQPVRRRADAERNIAAILDAAITCLGERPQATMAEIATAAGVGRVTLYGHFPSREALVTAALDRAVAEAAELSESVTGGMPPDAPADEVLTQHIHASWALLDRHRRLFAVAQRLLPADTIRDHHEPGLADLDTLIARGRRDGRFRTDLPVDWLVTVVYSLMHAAAESVNAGRLDRDDAAAVIVATILPVLGAPSAT